MSDSECEFLRKPTSGRKTRIFRSESREEAEPKRKSDARARKSKTYNSDSDSESTSTSKKPANKVKKSSPATKKRKTSETLRKDKKIYDLFGIGSSREDVVVACTSKKTLPSYFINRVANGNERRTAQTSGDFYVDFKVYESSDAVDTEAADLWKKALVRIKFQTSEESDQWRIIQKLVHNVSSLFKEEPHFYADK